MDWSELYLWTLVVMRMSGLVLLNPILGRNSLPNLVKAGMVLVFSVFAMSTAPLAPAVPGTVLAFLLHLLLEMGVGFVVGFVMHLAFMVIQVGGEVIDAQMGLTMAQVYDASSQINMTITASLLNVLMVLNFFAENGHYTMLRIFFSSHRVVPLGQAQFGQAIASGVAEIFLTSMVLAVKLAFPILAAELLGELGMGILMKAIPQINAFVINIELKVVIGLVLVFLFMAPLSEFLLGVEIQMLESMSRVLTILAAPA